MQACIDWDLIILGTQVIKKKQPVRPVFPDYLSVSYDYGATVRNVKYVKLRICKFILYIYIYIYIFATVFEKQPFRKISEIKLLPEAAIRMHFSISQFGNYVEII